MDSSRPIKDTNGNPLFEGDSVVVVKSYPIAGTPLILNRGQVIRNIRLTEDDRVVECRVDSFKFLLNTTFLKRG